MSYAGVMLELAILGFLAEGPSAGHLLRRRVSQLTGYTRPVSDGSLYPAINRLARAGKIERRADPVAGPGRYMLNLTDGGQRRPARPAALSSRTRHHRFHPVFRRPDIPVPTARRRRPACRATSPAGIPGPTRELLLRRSTPAAGRGARRPISARHAAHRTRHLHRRTNLAARDPRQRPAWARDGHTRGIDDLNSSNYL